MRKLRPAALVAATIAGLALVLWAGPAAAQVSPTGDVSPDAPVSAYLTINNTLVLLITGTLLPIVNGLLLRPSNPAWVKVLVAQIVAVAAHAFSQAVQADGAALLTQEWFVGLAMTVLAMIAAYLGIWKPAVDPNASVPTVVPLGDIAGGRPPA